MGTNMHIHIEVQKNNQWHHFGAPNIVRDYELFGLIAGERMTVARNGTPLKPIAKRVSQLPDDANLVTQVSYEQDKSSGAHNIFVLSAEDLVTLQDQLYVLHPEVPRTGVDKLDLEYSIFRHFINGNVLYQHQGWDDLRVIGWFE